MIWRQNEVHHTLIHLRLDNLTRAHKSIACSWRLVKLSYEKLLNFLPNAFIVSSAPSTQASWSVTKTFWEDEKKKSKLDLIYRNNSLYCALCYWSEFSGTLSSLYFSWYQFLSLSLLLNHPGQFYLFLSHNMIIMVARYFSSNDVL